jgi:hypothetical protein
VNGSLPAGRRRSWAGSRLALGLSPTPLSGIFLPIGIALGPEGLQLLSSHRLAFIDPVVSVALAALGVLIGLGLDMRRPGEGRLLAAASLEAGLTIAVVAAGLWGLAAVTPLPGLDIWLAAVVLGICAAASSTTPGGEGGPQGQTIVDRVGDLDDVLPILLGGFVLGLIRAPAPGDASWLTAQAIGLALVIAWAGSLLVARASSDAEQGVFAIGTILLLGGTAEFLALSPLLAGLVAGAAWSTIGGGVRERIARDVSHMQHLLVVLLLLIAGASVGFTAGLALFWVAYVTLRAAGKIAGGWLLRLVAAGAGRDLPPRLGLRLLSPGVVAIAFALNAARVTGEQGNALLVIAVAGSILSEIVSLLVRPRGRAR